MIIFFKNTRHLLIHLSRLTAIYFTKLTKQEDAMKIHMLNNRFVVGCFLDFTMVGFIIFDFHWNHFSVSMCLFWILFLRICSQPIVRTRIGMLGHCYGSELLEFMLHSVHTLQEHPYSLLKDISYLSLLF
jgi:hypothetical protein